MESQRSSRNTIDYLVVLAIGIVSAGVVLWQNSRLTVLWDLSYILENSYRMSLGEVPYRDFPFPYAPLTFLTQAAIIKLTGRVFFHHVIYCAVIAIISSLITWKILSRVLDEVPQQRWLALMLTLPLTVLGIYCIFPHPFYDPDCSLVVLVCLLLLVQWSRADTSRWWALGTGLVLPVPIFIKQNTGLAFICSLGAALTLLLVLDLVRRRPVKKSLYLLLGLGLTIGLALLLIHFTAGLGNYVRWTVRFAAERRTPAWREMLGIYTEPHLKWWLAAFLAGLIVLRLSKANRFLRIIATTLLTLPFVWPVIYLFLDDDSSERAERLVNLWPLILIVSAFLLILTWRRRAQADVILVVSIIGMVHGAFLSQQLWGSTYALWPFFVILAALIVKFLFGLSVDEEVEDKSASSWWAPTFIGVMSLCLTISGYFYLHSHERLDYANLDDGELVHSQLPALKGLSMRGSWIPDFEELISYVDKQIPRDEGILCLPGEDLFYYASGRHPQFPVLMFDHTVNPLNSQEIVDTARARNIQWLIVKNDLQLEEEPIEKKDELMKLLLKEFKSVESLNNYEIYKRRAAGSSDDKDEDDDSNDDDDGSDNSHH